jgi:uncharacterized DUF497 family protein
VRITYDPAKRARTLSDRGLDFEDAAKLFGGVVLQIEDDRRDYGEIRWITAGRLNGDVVVVVWTPRATARRIISMRKCHGAERQRIIAALDGSG